MFKKIIAFLLIFALAAVLCSCESIFPSGQSGETDENAPAETAPAEEEKGLGEDAWMASVSANTIVQSEGITTAFIKEWFEDHTVYAAYPIVENLDAVSEELKQFAVESIEGYESTLPDESDWDTDKPEFTMIYEPFTYEDTAISFKFVTYSDNGSTRVINRIDTFVYDKGSGEKLALSDLFKEDSDYLTEVSEASALRLEDDPVLSQYKDDEKIASGLKAEEVNFSRFVLDGGALKFYFNAGQIAVPEAGSFEVSIPLTELDSIKGSVLKGKSAIDAAAVVVMPDYFKTAEGDMEPFSIEGIDPMNDKVIALTFDDGPSPSTTPIVLEALKAHNAKATFFMVGQNAKEYPDTVKQVYDAGMEIGNHSYTHPDFYKMDYDGMAQELDKTNAVIKEATGKSPIIFRAPYGNVTAEAAQQYGRLSVYWTVDTLDWKNRDVQMNHDNTVGEAYDGALVLMHDIHPETASAVESIVSDLTAKGYKLITVSQLVQVLLARGQDPTWRLGRDALTSRVTEETEETENQTENQTENN